MTKAATPASKPARTVHAAPQGITTVSREDMVREAAYYLYENNGREPGHELEHWAIAEAQVDSMLRHAPPAPRRNGRHA